MCFFLLLCILSMQSASAQVDTVFTNEEGVLVDAGIAKYYRVISQLDSKLFEMKEYALNHTLKKVFQASSAQGHILEGEYRELDEDGKLRVEGNYHKGFKAGEWVYYFTHSTKKKEVQIFSANNEYTSTHYDSVTQKIEFKGGFDKYGKRTGLWTLYHFNSDSVKAISNYVIGKKEGQQFEYYKNGQIKRKELYTNNKLVKGEQFDEYGKKTKYYPAFSYPQYREYVSNYLQHAEPCVADALKKNDFQYSISLSKEGEVLDASVRSVQDPICAEKIRAAFLKMKKWKPALYENEPVKYTFESSVKLYVPKD